MNIPKELRGKKAEKLGILILSIIELPIIAESTKLFVILEYIKLYLQPFTPNMIEELFEGWEYNTDDSMYSYVYTNGEHRIITGKQYHDGCTFHYLYLKDYRFPFIKTLSDFIFACNNSGITLTFKKEK